METVHNNDLNEYILKQFFILKEKCSRDPGYFVNEEKYKKAISLFEARTDDITVLIKEVDDMANDLYISYKKWEREQIDEFLNKYNNPNEENDKLGITLNRQMIELMYIANTQSIEELLNIAKSLKIEGLSVSNGKSLEELKRFVFDKYLSDLTSREEYHSNNFANLKTKIKNVINNSELDNADRVTLENLINNGLENNMNSSQIFESISNKFGKEISSKIFVSLLSSRDLSEPGIKDYSMEDYKKLFNKVKQFRSITVDYESKYPSVHMPNGEFYFGNLERCLNFARDNQKDVRLNALIFFEDCPTNLSELEYNEENKKVVFNELLRYVDETTKFISKYNTQSMNAYGYEVVKSVDIFNELITRFSSDFNNQYLNREDVPKDKFQEAGWQKFLSVEDLCEIALHARKNLPNMEFVYNDINLEDPKKLEIFRSVMQRIQTFEFQNQQRLSGKRLVDCIGTQWHLSPYVTESQLHNSLKNLSTYNLPVKITEYDQPLSNEFISTHSPEECEIEKQKKQRSIKTFLENNRERYNIKQLTVWSLTDKTSFLLDNRNKNLIEKNSKPVESLYSGAFRPKKSFDQRSDTEIQIAEQIKQKNMIISQQKQQKLDKPKVRTLANNSTNGFVDTFVLTLMIGIVCGMLFIITYYILK